jgi:hypothetical protein
MPDASMPELPPYSRPGAPEVIPQVLALVIGQFFVPLQYPGPRQLKLVAQCLHVRSNNPQIFDDERQATQFLVHRFEKQSAWPRQPLPRLSRCCVRRNVPRSREPAEVISDSQSLAASSPSKTRDQHGVACKRRHRLIRRIPR